MQKLENICIVWTFRFVEHFYALKLLVGQQASEAKTREGEYEKTNSIPNRRAGTVLKNGDMAVFLRITGLSLTNS